MNFWISFIGSTAVPATVYSFSRVSSALVRSVWVSAFRSPGGAAPGDREPAPRRPAGTPDADRRAGGRWRPGGHEECPERRGVHEDPEGDQEGGDEHHREHGHERGGRLAEEQSERRWRRQEPGADR